MDTAATGMLYVALFTGLRDVILNPSKYSEQDRESAVKALDEIIKDFKKLTMSFMMNEELGKAFEKGQA